MVSRYYDESKRTVHRRVKPQVLVGRGLGRKKKKKGPRAFTCLRRSTAPLNLECVDVGQGLLRG